MTLRIKSRLLTTGPPAPADLPDIPPVTAPSHCAAATWAFLQFPNAPRWSLPQCWDHTSPDGWFFPSFGLTVISSETPPSVAFSPQTTPVPISSFIFSHRTLHSLRWLYICFFRLSPFLTCYTPWGQESVCTQHRIPAPGNVTIIVGA